MKMDNYEKLKALLASDLVHQEIQAIDAMRLIDGDLSHICDAMLAGKQILCNGNYFGYHWFDHDATDYTIQEPDHAKEFYPNRPVWVRDLSLEKWKPRYAAIYMPSSKRKFGAFSAGKKQETSDGITQWGCVSYTKPEGADDHE